MNDSIMATWRFAVLYKIFVVNFKLAFIIIWKNGAESERPLQLISEKCFLRNALNFTSP